MHLYAREMGRRWLWVGMGSGKCDEAAIASESAETSRAQDCGLTAVLLGRTKDSDALESPAVHLLNFCPNQGPLASFATRGEFQYPSGFRASLQGLVMMETASGCRKYMHSALQIGPDDEILPWKSNSAHTHRHTHTHTYNGSLQICQKPVPWTNDDLWEAAPFPAFLLLCFRRINPDHVFLLSLTHSKQTFCFPCTGERSSLKK